MNELALFAGAGGGLLGSRLLGWRTVCYVEKNPYCIEVIKARIRDGYLDDAPIWDDVQTFDGRPWAGLVDVITAGFPCQPFSGVGKRLGERDERNLWPDTLRVIREVRPEWCLLENVSRLLSDPYIRRIFADLAEGGYDCRWDCIPASAIGAPHQRDRIWIVAHANSVKRKRGTLQSECQKSCEGGRVWARRKENPNTNSGGQQAEKNFKTREGALLSGTDSTRLHRTTYWQTEHSPEPTVQRMADGVVEWVDRLTAIGNGQVPAVVRAAWRLLSGE